MRLNRFRDIIRTLLLFAAIIGAIVGLNRSNTETFQGSASVIDGDSIKLNGKEIRLLGIDAPEYAQTCKSAQNDQVYNCGKNAARNLRQLLSAGNVNCKGSEFDKYERFLAVCYSGDVEINRKMVSDGWAVSFGAYYDEERQAEEAKRGVWAGEFQSPSEWRKDAREAHSVSLIQSILDRLF